MSITSVKLELSEAIDLYEQLKIKLNDHGDLNSLSEVDWQLHIRNLGLDAAKLIQTSRVLDDDQLINVIKSKEKKLARHSAWAKRHKKRVQNIRKQTRKRNENWIKETEWIVTMAPSVNAAALKKAAPDESNVEKSKNKSSKPRSRMKELSRIVSKLTQLRDLRRKRLGSKGHFFAEDGNQFFDQVQKWNESNDIEWERKEDGNEVATKSASKHQKLVVNKEDRWSNMSIDERAYSYWCESDQSLEALLRNRRMWDQYIVVDSQDNDCIHKVPPTLVQPAPPANWIWASYLS